MGVAPENLDEEIRTHLQAKRYREAFDRIVTAYSSPIVRLSYSILGDRALAEDTAQECLLRVWRGLPGYRREAAIATWIFAIARNACWTALQTTPSRKLASMNDPDIRHRVENAPAEQTREPMSPELRRLIMDLPDSHRQVLMLFYMEDKSYEEVSRLLNLPLGTVKTYLHRARKALGTALMKQRVVKEA